uniref:Uncharacterized protein n=1 Tax=Manihot esculenta TaxID=3983 RepID=A0A2C9W1U4_MANES
MQGLSSSRSSFITHIGPLPRGVCILRYPCLWRTKKKATLNDHWSIYRDSCPQDEETKPEVILEIYKVHSSVASALLRLALIVPLSQSPVLSGRFCFGFTIFVQKLIMSWGSFDLSCLCPEVVPCADIVVLAARGVVQTATYELPSPLADLYEAVACFAPKCLDEREAVQQHLPLMCWCPYHQHPKLLKTAWDHHQQYHQLHVADYALHLLETGEGRMQLVSTTTITFLLRLIVFLTIVFNDTIKTGIKVRAYASDAYLFQRDFPRTMMTSSQVQWVSSGTIVRRGHRGD